MAWGDFVIQVGEEVGIARMSRSGTFLTTRFGTVTKINGHGHIFVQSGDSELRFTRQGKAYKNDWGPYLIHANQLRTQMKLEERRKEQIGIAREIEQIIKNGFTHSGRFFVNQEQVSNLKTLVCKLETYTEKQQFEEKYDVETN